MEAVRLRGAAQHPRALAAGQVERLRPDDRLLAPLRPAVYCPDVPPPIPAWIAVGSSSQLQQCLGSFRVEADSLSLKWLP